MSMSEKEKGYVAGFLDGEGSISIEEREQESGVFYIPTVDFSNNSSRTLRRIEDSLEDYSCNMSTQKYGGGAERNNLYISEQESIRKLLEELVDYLVIKESQAKLMIEFLEKLGNRDGYEYSAELRQDLKSIQRKMEKLNR